jgi:DNA polymerase-3 subunit gamma/tau
MTFALDYRPRRFAELAGQLPSAAVLYQMVRRGTVPSGLLFCGPRGTGKTSGARILGAALNCEEKPGPAVSWPCGTCLPCKEVAAGTSLYVQEVDAASHGGVEHVRDICQQVLYGTAGEHYVVIMDEAHSMSTAAGNAFLKTVEEPPPNTIFVFVTTEPARILPTIVSRCMTFTFQRITLAAIRDRLKFICSDKGISMEPDLLNAIALRADGAMRDAVMLLEQVSSVGITDLPRWKALLGETDFAPAVLRAAAAGDHPAMFAALDEAIASSGDYGWLIGQLVSCVRDVLVLASGGAAQACSGSLADRMALARVITPVRAVGALKVLWDLQTRVRAEDRAQGVQVACALVSDVLHPVREEPARSSGSGHGATSIEELRECAGGMQCG